MSRQNRIMLGALFVLGVLPLTIGQAAVQYDSILEWNGPYFRTGNSPTLDQMTDSPVGDIPFASPFGLAAMDHSSRDVIYVVDSGNNRVQAFEANATYVTAEESSFTFAGGGATAALEFDDNEILLGEWAAVPTNWVVPHSEVVVINGVEWTWVSDLSGFTTGDLVYTIDYDAAANGPEIQLVNGLLAANSTFEIRYLVTDNQTGAADGFGIGDVDYGTGAGATPVLTEITESSGGPTSFQQLRGIAAIANEETASSDDLFLIDSADDSGGQNEELFSYTVTDAGVVGYGEAYDDVLTAPRDVAVARSGASTAAAVTVPGAGPFTSGTITDASQVTGHDYTVTVAGTGVSITDATTGRVLLDTAPFASLADPFLGIPGISLPLNGVIGVTETISTTRAVSNRYLFVADTGGDRVKVIEAGDGAAASWPGDWLPSDARSLDAQPGAAIGGDATIDYSESTPATVTEDLIFWTTAFPIKEGTLESITFDPDGTPDTWTQIDNLAAAGPSDKVYQLDWTNGMIRFGDGIHGQLPPASTDFEYTYSTTPDLLRYGHTGTGAGRFDSPRGIAAHWNSSTGAYDVYVADTGNNRIQKLAFYPADAGLGIPARMIYLNEWDTASDANDPLDAPSDIVVKADGESPASIWLLVADQGNERVVIYKDTAAASGGGMAVPTFDTTLGSLGNSLGNYLGLGGITTLANGTDLDIYTVDGSRGVVTKYEESPTPSLTATWTGLPDCFPPSGSYKFTFSSSNAPDGGSINLYYDTASTFNAATAKLCLPLNSVASTATTALWVFADSPGGTPDDGYYYLFARMTNGSGNVVATDQTTSSELLCIDSKLLPTLGVADKLDNDNTLYMQNNLERVVNLNLQYPDSVLVVGYDGTFDATTLEILSIVPGTAWDGAGFGDVLFTSSYDNVNGTFQVNSSAPGSPIGLTTNGPHNIAEITFRAKPDAINLTSRAKSGSVSLVSGTSMMSDVNGVSPPALTTKDMAVEIAYLGDFANPAGTGGDSPKMAVAPDGFINFNDQMAFTLGWNGANGVQDPLADIGPATGTPPDLISNPDGQWNVDDILVFTQMYSWASTAGFTGGGGDGSALSVPRVPLPRPAPLGEDVAGTAQVFTVSHLDNPIPDSEVTVDVVVRSDEGLTGGLFTLGYDPHQFEPVRVAPGEYLQGSDGTLFFRRAGDDWLEISTSRLDHQNPLSYGEGVVAHVTFRILDDAVDPFDLSYDLRTSHGDVVARGSSKAGPLTGGATPFMLYANYPNPMVQSTNLVFSVPKATDVSLDLFNAGGRLIRNLFQGHAEAGFHVVPFDGKDASNGALPAGIYFYKIHAGEDQMTRKLVIAR